MWWKKVTFICAIIWFFSLVSNFLVKTDIPCIYIYLSCIIQGQVFSFYFLSYIVISFKVKFFITFSKHNWFESCSRFFFPILWVIEILFMELMCRYWWTLLTTFWNLWKGAILLVLKLHLKQQLLYRYIEMISDSFCCIFESWYLTFWWNDYRIR